MFLHNGNVGCIPVKFQMKIFKYIFQNKSLIMGQRQKARLTGSNNSCLVKEEGKSPSVLLELQFFLLPLKKY